jgi:signal transduction histidine kinase
MRRRLLGSTLTIVLATVLLFGVPLIVVLNRVVHDEAQDRLVRDATRIAREIQREDAVSLPRDQLERTLKRLVPSDNHVVLLYPNGTSVTAGDATSHPVSATVPAANGTELILQSPSGDVSSRVERALIVVALVAIGALTGALLLALWQSRRLADPLARLARAAGRLGEGDFSLSSPRSNVQEIDEIADALDRSAARIGRLLQAERSFSAYAGHQLRTALTGLQLRIEELAGSDDESVRAEAEAALEQSARLNRIIDELLALARTGRAGIVTGFDLADLARRHAEDVQPLLARGNRNIRIDASEPVPIVAAVGAVGQILDILMSNAVRHGTGTVVVRVTADERRATLDVEDAGPGIAPSAVDTLFEPNERPGGHGIGLALARTLVVTEGGTITLVRARPPLMRVEFPRA